MDLAAQGEVGAWTRLQGPSDPPGLGAHPAPGGPRPPGTLCKGKRRPERLPSAPEREQRGQRAQQEPWAPRSEGSPGNRRHLPPGPRPRTHALDLTSRGGISGGHGMCAWWLELAHSLSGRLVTSVGGDRLGAGSCRPKGTKSPLPSPSASHGPPVVAAP